MNLFQHLRICFLAGVVLLSYSAAQAQASTAAAPQPKPATERDGQHDFDFEFGHWKSHNRRLLHPLSGANDWVEFDADLVARPLWGGRANVDEVEADTPAGHIEGMSVRTYNTKSHQWSIYWANQKNGSFSLPATVGYFKDGVGEFYDQENWNGVDILVRFTWTVTNPDQPRWEQAFSVDGGKTWETNWVATFTRVSNETNAKK